MTAKLAELRKTNEGLVEEIRVALDAKADRGRDDRRDLGAREKGLCHLAQDGQQADQPGAAVRHLRVPRDRRLDRRLLSRSRRRAHNLADSAGPLQGLHLDAQAEQLPVDPHHGGRPAPSARRAADPHPRHARDRRVRRRRARPLQGRWRGERPGGWQARRLAAEGQRALCLAAPACRDTAGRDQTPRSSSSTPSSSCSRTRCSASRPRAA